VRSHRNGCIWVRQARDDSGHAETDDAVADLIYRATSQFRLLDTRGDIYTIAMPGLRLLQPRQDPEQEITENLHSERRYVEIEVLAKADKRSLLAYIIRFLAAYRG